MYQDTEIMTDILFLSESSHKAQVPSFHDIVQWAGCLPQGLQVVTRYCRKFPYMVSLLKKPQEDLHSYNLQPTGYGTNLCQKDNLLTCNQLEITIPYERGNSGELIMVYVVPWWQY